MRADPLAEFPCLRRIKRQTLLEEDVLQAHHAEAHGAPLVVRVFGFGRRVVVDVNDTVEERNDLAHNLTEALEVELVATVGSSTDEAAQVERTEVADSRVVLVGDLEDFGAQVGQVHNTW